RREQQDAGSGERGTSVARHCSGHLRASVWLRTSSGRSDDGCAGRRWRVPKATPRYAIVAVQTSPPDFTAAPADVRLISCYDRPPLIDTIGTTCAATSSRTFFFDRFRYQCG